MSDKIARHYNAKKNADNAAFPGVPLRDITDDEFNSYPKWLQNSIDASDFYTKTDTSKSAKASAKAESEPTE